MNKETSVSQYTNAVAHLVTFLNELYPEKSLNFSDVQDNIKWDDAKKRRLLEKYHINIEERRQYADIVQEGGGVHGIALAGYTYILEKMGISFLNSAGTSAGAINTMLLNCVYSKRDAILMDKNEEFIDRCYETRSEKILDYLSKKNLSELVDGHITWQNFILKLFSKKDKAPLIDKIKRKAKVAVYSLLFSISLLMISAIGVGISLTEKTEWTAWVNGILITSVIVITLSFGLIIVNGMSLRFLYFNSEKMGINPGENFKQWMIDVMNDNGIRNVLDLQNKMLNENKLFNLSYDAFIPGVGRVSKPDSILDSSREKLSNITQEVSDKSKINLLNQAEERDELKIDALAGNQEGKEKTETVSLRKIDSSTESKVLKYLKEIQPSTNSINFKELSKDLIDNQTKGIVGYYIKVNGDIAEDQHYIDELLNRIISGTTDFNQTNWKDLKTINDKIIESDFNPLNNNQKLIDLLVTKFYSFTKKVVNAKKNKFTQQLVVVAADITNQIKVEFPGMHEFYWGDDYTISPAEYIRASMSIPFFFSPYKITLPNSQLIKINEIWRNKMNVYKNFTPQNKEVFFVDGGMLSNFPINVFYDNISYCIPTRPTIGIKLEFDSDDFYKQVDNEFKLSLSMLSTMRFFYDRDFMQKHNDFKRTVRSVDTGSISWLNFNPTENEKLELFYRGALAATIFLAGENLTNVQKNELLEKAKKDFAIEDFKTEDLVYPDILFNWENYKFERAMAEIYKNLSPKLKEKSSFIR